MDDSNAAEPSAPRDAEGPDTVAGGDPSGDVPVATTDLAPQAAPTALPEERPTASRAAKPVSRFQSPRGYEDTAASDALPFAAAPHPDAAISPRMTAIFGGLFGLATVASLLALLIQIFPIKPETARPAAPTAASSSPAGRRALSRPQPQIQKRKRTILPGPWRLKQLRQSHLIKQGVMKQRSFIKVLSEDKVPKKQIYRIIKALEGLHNFDRTGRNDRYAVAMKRSNKRVMAFEYELSPTEVYQARENNEGLLNAKRLDMKVRESEFSSAFYIGPDFVKSYRQVGLEPGLSRVINKAFNGRTSTEAFSEGGSVRLIAVEQTALGRFVRYSRIRAIEYRPPDPAKKPMRAYWFQGSSKGVYFDGRGRRPSNRGWRTPCPGAPVTSQFNPKRMHPVLKRIMPHNGTDFGAPSGTPVHAAYRGTISYVGRRGASGNLVLIEHPGSIQTGYAHLSRFAKGIRRGDRVGTRQLIGYVGSTGRSTGPHLHFSAKRNGKFFNALELRLDALHMLPISERSTFLSQKSALDRALERIARPEPPPEPEPLPEPAPAPAPVPAPAPQRPAEQAGSASSTKDSKSPQQGPSTAAQPNEAQPVANPPAPAADDEGEDLRGDDLSGDIE